MVNQGNFSLRLINASTMKPLQEHSSSTGKPYVTLASNVDFLVHLEALRTPKHPIVYQISVPNSATRHNFKRKQQQLLGGDDNNRPSIFRFDRAHNNTSSSHQKSVDLEKVAVRIFEASDNGRRKYLQTITLHCAVLPSFNKAVYGERATSLGSLLAAGTTANANYSRDTNSCLLKKNHTPVPMSPTALARSRLTPERPFLSPLVL